MLDNMSESHKKPQSRSTQQGVWIHMTRAKSRQCDYASVWFRKTKEECGAS